MRGQIKAPWRFCERTRRCQGLNLADAGLAAERARAFAGLLCLTALLLTGCASVGPSTVTRDRFDYVTSISDSWKQQMLLNLLKVRYADAPVFLDVASVINSYSLESDINLSGQYAEAGRGNTFVGVGVTGRYADTPTITYLPFTGDKFARSLMAPIPVTGILFLLQSGYPADFVLRICVNTINGLENAYGGPGSPRPGNPKFRELMTALREAQTAGGMGMRIKTIQAREAVVMFLRPGEDEAIAAPNQKIRELLGLDAQAREFTIVYGAEASSDTEIAILSRSMLQILTDVASHIDVPPADVAEGRVYSPQRTPEQQRMFPALVNVRHGSSQPDDAHVGVRYREQWFWIDDRDRQSKLIFTFLMLMFSLTETGATQAGAPVITVPAR
jgi:hypothetical protein